MLKGVQTYSMSLRCCTALLLYYAAITVHHTAPAQDASAMSVLMYVSALEEAEIIPGKNSDTRIKPLALTNGHGRYMAVTPERTLASVEECPLNI